MLQCLIYFIVSFVSRAVQIYCYLFWWWCILPKYILMAAGGSGERKLLERGNEQHFGSRFGGIEATVFGELGLTMLYSVTVC